MTGLATATAILGFQSAVLHIAHFLASYGFSNVQNTQLRTEGDADDTEDGDTRDDGSIASTFSSSRLFPVLPPWKLWPHREQKFTSAGTKKVHAGQPFIDTGTVVAIKAA